MTSKLLRSTFALAALAACAAPMAAQRWRIQYQHEEPKSALTIVDLQFPSATRGVAVGYTTGLRGGKPKHVALVTSDAGAHWQTVPLKGQSGSLFFLNETLGWMASGKTLWKTTEAGKNWIRLPNPGAQLVRVYFKDEKTGWAACTNKTVLETHDGGQRWSRVAAASEQPGDAANTAYAWIAFSSPEYGVITGWNAPPMNFRRFNDWMEPEAVANRREFPRLNLTLTTRDGGQTWRPTSVSMFGELTRIRFGTGGRALGLVEHAPSFEYPSEVHQLGWPDGQGKIAFRQKDVFVTDIWVAPDGTFYAAGTSANARVRVVPQKVRVFRNDGSSDRWAPIPVDYRAVARRVILAGDGGGGLWMATDNGMILKLSDK